MVRWVEQGVGCSKVPDINDVGLMEDRAAAHLQPAYCQLAAPLALHKQQVVETMQRMTSSIGRTKRRSHRPTGPELRRSVAFQAAMDLIFDGEGAKWLHAGYAHASPPGVQGQGRRGRLIGP